MARASGLSRNILVQQRGRGLVTLHRLETLNELNKATIDELVAVVTARETDPEVGAVVVTAFKKGVLLPGAALVCGSPRHPCRGQCQGRGSDPDRRYNGRS